MKKLALVVWLMASLSYGAGTSIWYNVKTDGANYIWGSGSTTNPIGVVTNGGNAEFDQLYVTNAYRMSTNPYASDEFITLDKLNSELAELSPLQLWGVTNVHPYLGDTFVLSYLTPVNQGIFTNALSSGSNFIARFAYTNPVNAFLREGLWQLESYSYKSGISDVRLRCYLKIGTADGLTNTLFESSLSDPVNGTLTYNSMHGHIETNYFVTSGTNWYPVVEYWAIQDGIPSTTLYTFLNTNAPSSHVDVPGLVGPELASTASAISTDVSSFDGVLSSADTTVQKALDTLDDKAGDAGAITNWGGSAIDGSLIPSTSNAYDLGSSLFPFRDLHIGTNSLYIDGIKSVFRSNAQTCITSPATQDGEPLITASDEADPHFWSMWPQIDNNFAELTWLVQLASDLSLAEMDGRVVDTFTDLTGLLLASTTNYGYSSGVLTLPQLGAVTYDTTTNRFRDTTNATALGYTDTRYPVNAIDGNGSSTWGHQSVQPTWWKIDLSSNVAIGQVQIDAYTDGSGAAVRDFAVDGSLDNTNWTTLGGGTHGNNGNKEAFSFGNVTAYRYYKFTFTNDWRADTWIICEEIEGYRSIPPAPTNYAIATSVDFYTLTPPTNARVTIDMTELSPTNRVSFGTNVFLYASRDGSTFTPASMAVQRWVSPTNFIASGDVDLSGQPSGTSMVWRVLVTNSCPTALSGVALSWR